MFGFRSKFDADFAAAAAATATCSFVPNWLPGHANECDLVRKCSCVIRLAKEVSDYIRQGREGVGAS